MVLRVVLYVPFVKYYLNEQDPPLASNKASWGRDQGKSPESTTWLLSVSSIIKLLICLNEQDPLNQAGWGGDQRILQGVLERTTWLRTVFSASSFPTKLCCPNEQDPLERAVRLVEVEIKEESWKHDLAAFCIWCEQKNSRIKAFVVVWVSKNLLKQVEVGSRDPVRGAWTHGVAAVL